MSEWRKTILVTVAALAVSGLAYADMAPVVVCVADGPETVVAHESVDLLGLDLSGPSVADLGSLPLSGLPIGLPAGIVAGAEASEAPSAIILTDRQDSLTLCLYALMGLGLCKSAPWVRKFSFGVIPQWYHEVGPWQVGHSHAVAPDCLSHLAVCLVQPERVPEPLLPQYRTGTIWSLLRKSQFTLTTLASRGPPRMS